MTARDRTLQAITTRLDSTEKSETLRRAIQQPALYDGTGTIKSLGAAGGVPVRGLNATGGLAVGEPVGANQGIVNGRPDAATQEDLQAAVNFLLQQIGRIRNRRGIQVFDGDPNTNDPQAYQDFGFQFLYDQLNKKIYYAQTSDGVTPTLWVEIEVGGSGSAIIFSTDPPPFPTTGSPSNGDRWHDTTTDRLWTYDETADLYRPAGTKNFVGAPPTSDPDAFVDGDRVSGYNNFNGALVPCEWEWRTDDWVLMSCCEGCLADPPGQTCPAGEGIDPTTGFCSIP